MVVVEKMLSVARERLVMIDEDALLTTAARLLNDRHTNLVVARDKRGTMTGVVTKTDIVRQLSHCSGSGCTAPVAAVMTRDITCCRLDDALQDVWSIMKERNLLHVPIVDEGFRPIGVVNARDALLVLLEGSEYEEALLRDYVMGIGYQ
ncbi:MAG TPA: CBS domain-containing protein [Reyranella sp.]|jgi:CBS domain-containing protein|nr:CBS domain-containing protein [Reyranella sp.]